jgi:hypothetical protein
MSLVTLNTVRYLTADDVYHYTVDNRPLQDLASNDVLLQAGLDILAASISAGGVTSQDFIAGTDFTVNVTTSLTLSSAPATINSLWIFFDGVYQNVTTYTLNGNVVTFGSVIPTGVSSVEIKWSNAGSVNAFSTTSVLTVGDANSTLPVARDTVVVFNAPITANRTATLSTSSTQGFKVRVVRSASATGEFSITVSNGTGLKILNSISTWADFIYTGTAWIETASGSL